MSGMRSPEEQDDYRQLEQAIQLSETTLVVLSMRVGDSYFS